MIILTIETSITREFHLDEAEEIAKQLNRMDYELEDKATAKYAISSMSELAALLKLASPIEREDIADIEISCGCR